MPTPIEILLDPINPAVPAMYATSSARGPSLHQAQGVHRHNHADLRVIDMLFGTFRNPREAAPATGFWHGASDRVGRMLLARNVSRP